jgi:hypothetical protein
LIHVDALKAMITAMAERRALLDTRTSRLELMKVSGLRD